MSEKNIVCWVDIPVVDLDRAVAFYSKVLGDTVKKIADHGMEFGLFPHTENSVAGCLAVMDDRKPSQDGSLIYLNVEGRLDQAIQVAEMQGAKILKRKEQIGPYGYRAVFVDCEGNAVALYSKEA